MLWFSKSVLVTIGPAVTSTKINRLEEMKYGVKRHSKSYRSDHVFVVIAEIVAIIVHIGVLVHGWKHVRFGWLHENDLFIREMYSTYRERLGRITPVATARQFHH